MLAQWWKGWLLMSKLKKIWQGLVGFGCNLAQLIAYLCRSYSLVGTQIQQRQQSKLGTLHYSPLGKNSLFGCKASNPKGLVCDDWAGCHAGFHATMYHLVLKVVGITLSPKDPYDTFGCMNTFPSLYRFSFSRASPSAKGISITPFPRDPYDTVG